MISFLKLSKTLKTLNLNLTGYFQLFMTLFLRIFPLGIWIKKSSRRVIKSNYFKDWTVRQAIKDANEEIKIFTKEIATTA